MIGCDNEETYGISNQYSTPYDRPRHTPTPTHLRDCIFCGKSIGDMRKAMTLEGDGLTHVAHPDCYIQVEKAFIEDSKQPVSKGDAVNTSSQPAPLCVLCRVGFGNDQFMEWNGIRYHQKCADELLAEARKRVSLRSTDGVPKPDQAAKAAQCLFCHETVEPGRERAGNVVLTNAHQSCAVKYAGMSKCLPYRTP
jgi:ribosomal protein L24E